MHRPANEVILPPVSSHLYSFTSTEPQYVSTRVPNQGWLYISSQDAPAGADRTNCTIGSSEVLATAMARIKVMGFATYWNVPNVNPRNNVIGFQSSLTPPGPPVIYTTAPLNERYYNFLLPADVAALAADIAAKMTAVAPGGQTFIMVPVPGFPNTFDIQASLGTSFFFDLASSAVAKGAQMFGFPRDQVLTNTKRAVMNFSYTQYIDITSSKLTKWDKMQSASTGRINPLVMRAYVGGRDWDLKFQDITNHPVEFSWKADEPLSAIDFRFFDMNGDPLYQLNGGKDWIWQLSLLAEM